MTLPDPTLLAGLLTPGAAAGVRRPPRPPGRQRHLRHPPRARIPSPPSGSAARATDAQGHARHPEREGHVAGLPGRRCARRVGAAHRGDGAGGRRTAGGSKGKVVQRARVIFKEDSAAVDDVTGHGLADPGLRHRARARCPISTCRSRCWSRPFGARGGRVRGRRRCRSSISAAGRRWSAKVSPLGADSLALAIGSVEFHLQGGCRRAGARRSDPGAAAWWRSGWRGS